MGDEIIVKKKKKKRNDFITLELIYTAYILLIDKKLVNNVNHVFPQKWIDRYPKCALRNFNLIICLRGVVRFNTGVSIKWYCTDLT